MKTRRTVKQLAADGKAALAKTLAGAEPNKGGVVLTEEPARAQAAALKAEVRGTRLGCCTARDRANFYRARFASKY